MSKQDLKFTHQSCHFMPDDTAIGIDWAIIGGFIEPFSDIVDLLIAIYSENQIRAINDFSHAHDCCICFLTYQLCDCFCKIPISLALLSLLTGFLPFFVRARIIDTQEINAFTRTIDIFILFS